MNSKCESESETKVRLSKEDRKEGNMKATQIAQNKMLRVLDATSLRERKSTKDLLESQQLLSVNQLAAQIKLTEAWKATHDPEYPIKMVKDTNPEDNYTRVLRPSSVRTMEEGGKTQSAQTSFVRDAGKVWNRAPRQIKEAVTLTEAKKEIKTYCKTLPI